jgi:flagellar biosynthetic protein FlhB
MAEQPATEKTEQPTSKRLGEVRGKGQVPQSMEMVSSVSLAVLLLVVALQASELMRWFTVQMREGMACNSSIFADVGSFMNFASAKIVSSLFIMFPILFALSVGGIVTSIVIAGGFNFAPGALRLRLDQLNPISGLGNLVNLTSGVKLLASILKLLFVSIIVWFYMRNKIEMLASLRWAWSMGLLTVIARMIFGMMIRVCIALLLIGVADATYQKWKYTKDLKMTKQEVKEELKASEGSPEVKRQIKKKQFQAVLKRMMQEVPKANVVLVNPEHVAVALRYDAKTMEAPVVVAKGADHLAEKIREIARAYGVPIIRRPELARTIYSTVELDGPIPQELYVAVAEVLALIYRLRHRK